MIMIMIIIIIIIIIIITIITKKMIKSITIILATIIVS